MFGAVAEEKTGEAGSDIADKRYVEQIGRLLAFFFQRSSPSIRKRLHCMAALKNTETFQFNDLIGS